MIQRLKHLTPLFALLYMACNTPEKLLSHTWALEDVDFDEVAWGYDKEMKQQIVRQLRDSAVFVFNKNHTYRFKLPDRVEVGTWQLNAAGDTLFTNYEHGGGVSKVNSLTKDFLNVDTYDKSNMHMKFILRRKDAKNK